MSYIVIDPDGTVTRHDTNLTPDDLIRLVGPDGAPQPLPTPANVVVWVNDNFVSLHERGAAARNLVASLAVIGMDVPGTPIIAGPAVLAEMMYADGQYLPGPLSGRDADALMVLLGETQEVVAGREVPGLPQEIQDSLRVVLELVKVRPLSQVEVRTITLEEFTSFLAGRGGETIPMPIPHDGPQGDGPGW